MAVISLNPSVFVRCLFAAARGAIPTLLVLVALPIAVPAAAPRAGTMPAEMLRGIYQEAVKGVTSDWLEPERRGNYLSKSLLALWAKLDAKKSSDGEAGPIDFDLTTDTNGLELQGFDVKIVSQSSSTAVAAVRLDYRKPYYRPGPPAVVTYEFVREDGHWRIDNFRTSAWSVRDLLAIWLSDT